MKKTDSVLGRKNDDNKLRWDLLPWEEVEEIVEILTFGSKKYSDKKTRLDFNSMLSLLKEELEKCDNVIFVKSIEIFVVKDYVDLATKNNLENLILNLQKDKEIIS